MSNEPNIASNKEPYNGKTGFIRIEVYGREIQKGKKNRANNWNVKDIIDEATRKPEACHHVENPLPPNLVFGVSPEIALQEAVEKVEKEKIEVNLASGGKAYKAVPKSQGIMLCGVASYPKHGEEYDLWKAETLGFLKDEYGTNLKSVVEHLDEEHPHIHFYVVADTVHKTRLLHPGVVAQDEARRVQKAAQDEAQRLGKPVEKTTPPRTAYTAAMSEFLTSYHKKVGLMLGMNRLGPSRQRFTRPEYKTRIHQQNELAKKLQETKKIEEKAIEEGLEKGKQLALAKTYTFGEKTAFFFTSMIGGFHKPTAKIVEQYKKIANNYRKQREEIKAKSKAKIDELEKTLDKKDQVIQDQRLKVMQAQEMTEYIAKENQELANKLGVSKSKSTPNDRFKI
jgi:hypothetical protein